MRGTILFGWLLIPAVVAAYHYGPGQQRLVVDDAAACLDQANRHVAAEDWEKAIDRFEAALVLLPDDQVDAIRRVRLQRDKAQLMVGQLPAAYDDLTLLLGEMEDDPKAPAPLKADVRTALASAQYYLTWLMRLEGAPRDEWEPQIEASRQNYRLLAEQAGTGGETQQVVAREEDLESAIRLARMDLADLQGLPLPSQCQGCKSGQCKCKGKSQSKRTGEKDARGAGSGPPPDNRGS